MNTVLATIAVLNVKEVSFIWLWSVICLLAFEGPVTEHETRSSPVTMYCQALWQDRSTSSCIVLHSYKSNSHIITATLLTRVVATKFRVVRYKSNGQSWRGICITCTHHACTRGVRGHAPPGKFWIFRSSECSLDDEFYHIMIRISRHTWWRWCQPRSQHAGSVHFRMIKTGKHSGSLEKVVR